MDWLRFNSFLCCRRAVQPEPSRPAQPTAAVRHEPTGIVIVAIDNSFSSYHNMLVSSASEGSSLSFLWCPRYLRNSEVDES